MTVLRWTERCRSAYVGPPFLPEPVRLPSLTCTTGVRKTRSSSRVPLQLQAVENKGSNFGMLSYTLSLSRFLTRFDRSVTYYGAASRRNGPDRQPAYTLSPVSMNEPIYQEYVRVHRTTWSSKE